MKEWKSVQEQDVVANDGKQMRCILVEILGRGSTKDRSTLHHPYATISNDNKKVLQKASIKNQNTTHNIVTGLINMYNICFLFVAGLHPQRHK